MLEQARPVVLIVEDEPLVRLGAVDQFEDFGYEVLEAGSADDAILVLEGRADITVVFTDVDMPGTMDGLKLAHYVRDRWPPIKLIVTSGLGAQLASSLPPGVPFLAKPYLTAQLQSTLAA